LRFFVPPDKPECQSGATPEQAASTIIFPALAAYLLRTALEMKRGFTTNHTNHTNKAGISEKSSCLRTEGST
jgi:hypothetical protein